MPDILKIIPDKLTCSLKEQTQQHVLKNESIEYIKFVIADKIEVGRKESIPFVITEIHLEKDTQWLTNDNSLPVKFDIYQTTVKNIIQHLCELLNVKNDANELELHFAGNVLSDYSPLNPQGIVYPDKVFFPLKKGVSFSENSYLFEFYEFKEEFKKIAHIIRANNDVYLDSIKKVDSITQNEKKLNDNNLWKYLLIIRYFAVFDSEKEVRSNQRNWIKIIKYMLKLLEKLYTRKEYWEVQYSLINALEWQSYMYPHIFVERSNSVVGDMFGKLLCQIIDDIDVPSRVRIEACWAISWAGISNYKFSERITPLLFSIIEKKNRSKEKKGIITSIFVALMRSTLIRYLYIGADNNDNFGWFHNTISDHNLLKVTNSNMFKEGFKFIDLDEYISKIEDPNVLLGLGSMFSILERHEEAAKCYEESSWVNDLYVQNFRKGLSLMELAETINDIETKIDDLLKAKNYFQAALDVLNEERFGRNITFLEITKFKLNLVEARSHFLFAIKEYGQYKLNADETLFKNMKYSFDLSNERYRNIPEVRIDDMDILVLNIFRLFSSVCSKLSEKITKNELIEIERNLQNLKKDGLNGYKNFFQNVIKILSDISIETNRNKLIEKISKIDFPQLIANCPLSECPTVKMELIDLPKSKGEIYLINGYDKSIKLNYYEDISFYREKRIPLKIYLLKDDFKSNDQKIIECIEEEIEIYYSYNNEQKIFTGLRIRFKDLFSCSSRNYEISLYNIFSHIKKFNPTLWPFLNKTKDNTSFTIKLSASFKACSGRSICNIPIRIFFIVEFEYYPNRCILMHDPMSQTFNECLGNIKCMNKKEVFLSYKFSGNIFDNKTKIKETQLIDRIKNIFDKYSINAIDSIEIKGMEGSRICELCEKILTRKFFIAELSLLSLNVWFEIGLSMAKNKRIYGIIHQDYEKRYENVPALRFPFTSIYNEGIFDSKITEIAKDIQSFNVTQYRLEAFSRKYPKLDESKTQFRTDILFLTANKKKWRHKEWSKEQIYRNHFNKLDVDIEIYDINENSFNNLGTACRKINKATNVIAILDSEPSDSIFWISDKNESESNRDIYNCSVCYLMGIAAGFEKNIILLRDDTSNRLNLFDVLQFSHVFSVKDDPEKTMNKLFPNKKIKINSE